MASTFDYIVVLLDPRTGGPMRHVDIEAFKESDGTSMGVVRTNDQGFSEFHALSDQARFHARVAGQAPSYQVVMGGGPGSGLGPFEYDYLIDKHWATVVSDGQGTEGQSLTVFHGFTFRVYSTIDGAMAHAEALAANSSRSFFIVPADVGDPYQETVNRGPPTGADWFIHGVRMRTVWRASGDSQKLFNKKNNTDGDVHIKGILFDQASTSSGMSITNALNWLGSITECDFIGGNSDDSSQHVVVFNALGLNITNCTWQGNGIGISEQGGVTPVTDLNVSTCWFKVDIGIKLAQASSINISTCNFSCGTDDILLASNVFRVSITNSHFDKGIHGGPSSFDQLLISTNTFQLSSGETGIQLSPSVNSEALTIGPNTFDGSGTAVGIDVEDAQVISGVISLNTFEGFTSGNEIKSSGVGADVDIFHNISDAGEMADVGFPVGHAASGTPIDDMKWATATELTISSGAITATQSHHTIDTENDDPSDILTVINGLVANQLYFFYPAHTDRTIVLKHGTGNLLCIGNQDFELNDTHDYIWAFSPDGSSIYVGGPHNAPVFISDTEPSSKQDGQLWLDTDATGTGGLGVLNVITITTNTTLTDSQTVVLCDASSGSFTVTLPTAVGRDGRHYTIKKIDATANTVTIDGDGSETIDDGLTAVITQQYESITIVSDGAAWFIL